MTIFAACLQPRLERPRTHPYLRPQTSSRRLCVGDHALVSRPSSQVSPPAAVTATPSGSSGVELEPMEHAVDPSRCAVKMCHKCAIGPLLRAVPADHEGRPKPHDLRKHRLAP